MSDLSSDAPDLHLARASQRGFATQDRLPPYAAEAERAVIGAALLDPHLAPELRLEWFYDLRHRAVADVILSLSANSKPVEVFVVIQRLKDNGIADAVNLANECQDGCASPANFSYWRDILLEKLTLRRIQQSAQTAIINTDSNNSPADILDEYERDVLSIRQQITGDASGVCDLRATVLELVNDYEQAATDGRPRGVQTGFPDLDKLTGGLKPQQFFVIAARPSVGKTSLAMNIAEHVALDAQQPVGFFSLEMSAKELVHRLACSRGRVDSSALNEGRASQRDIQIFKAPLRICDRGGLTLAQLTARARRMVQQHGITVLIVDYLGLLRSGDRFRSRYEETTLVSNGLKCLAKEINLPLIVLAQLNRDAERETRPPRMSDLRDSGAIEQDADIIGLLHRDENQTGTEQEVNLIISKNRTGRTGVVPLIFRRDFTRFESRSKQ